MLGSKMLIQGRLVKKAKQFAFLLRFRISPHLFDRNEKTPAETGVFSFCGLRGFSTRGVTHHKGILTSFQEMKRGLWVTN
jgi:hypothetical protein